MLFKPEFKTQSFGICRLPGLLVFMAAAVLVLSSSVTEAATYYWNATSGDWSTAAFWGGTEPTINDYAYIRNGGTATIT